MTVACSHRTMVTRSMTNKGVKLASLNFEEKKKCIKKKEVKKTLIKKKIDKMNNDNDYKDINLLSKINRHPRDINIQFTEEDHKYIILTDQTSEYTSVTTWNHKHFEEFDSDSVIDKMMNGKNWNSKNKYWGMSKEEINKQWNDKRDSYLDAGTKLHFEIENYHNNNKLPKNYTNNDLLKFHSTFYTKDINHNNDNNNNNDSLSIELKYFTNFIKDHPDLQPYRTEWRIYDEDIKIAGSIDMVYKNPDGTLSIYDWKRTQQIKQFNDFNKFAITPLLSHIPDSNYWHYALQLNTYKFILERKYNKKIKDLYLVRLHPNADNYELYKLPILNTEMVDTLLLNT